MFKQTGLSHQVIAEQKAAHAYHNLEVLNSYWVGDDGNTSYFEIILADPMILDLSTLARKGRAFRGLTASGQKGRPSKKVIPNKARRRKMHLKKLAHEHGRRAASENAQ
jgi:large subunit ribosomal protein L15e